MDENNVMQDVVTSDVATNVTVVDDGIDTGHKIIFYVGLALLAVTPVGIGILIWRLVKRKKQVKQLQGELDATKAMLPPPAPEVVQAEVVNAPEQK